MRSLNLFSIFTTLILLASCHSSDVALRHSRIRTFVTDEPQRTEHQIEVLESQSTLSTSAKTDSTTQLQANAIQSTAESVYKLLLPITHKQGLNTQQKQHEQLTAPHKSRPHTATAAAKQSTKHYGLFGHIGHSFCVVGLVFIIAGIVLVLIGGIIIDTLAALAIAFGFVFILIWLVLAILQGLFDVIL